MHCIMEDVKISKIHAMKKGDKMIKTAFLKANSIGDVNIRSLAEDKEFNL